MTDRAASPHPAGSRCSPSSAGPTSGKSTLVNRIIGRREAVVAGRPRRDPRPGLLRRRTGTAARSRSSTPAAGTRTPAAWPSGSPRRPRSRSTLADAVLFVVDATVGITDADEAVVQDPAPVGQAGRAGRQQGRRPARRGRGVRRCGTSGSASRTRSPRCTAAARATCSTRSSPRCPSRRRRPYDAVGGPRRVAIVGKPQRRQVLAAEQAGRARTGSVVDDVAGTTVDPVDELVELGGRTWRFIDTAGIRKRVKEASGHEYYASLRTNTAIERAEVCVVVVDGSQPLSEQDLRIITAVAEAGRALVIAFNKWDLVDEERRYYLDREIERDLVRVQWAPRINITARTGWHVDRLVPALDAALEGWETRVATGALNSFLGRLVAEHPHPVRGGKQPRILFGTQASTAPPTFVLFTSRPARGVVPAVHRAPAARGVRLRRHARCTCSSARAAGSASSRFRCRREAAIRFTGPRVVRRRGHRAVAQFGSALDWGSRGRRFKSCQPDHVMSRDTVDGCLGTSFHLLGSFGGGPGRRPTGPPCGGRSPRAA